MDSETKAKVGQLRGGIGILLAILWIGYWWLRLDGEKRAALEAGCKKPGFLGSIQDAFQGAGAACHSEIDGNFTTGMFLAVIVSPLAFWIAHYIAKSIVSYRQQAEETRQAKAEQERQRDKERSIAQFSSDAAKETAEAQRVNDRHELITRLGAVEDQLIVLEGESDPQRVTRIKMTIAQALRDIDAKFTDAELQGLMAEHSSIRQRVDRTLDEMRKLGLEGGRQYADLLGMFGMSGGTSEGERAAADEAEADTGDQREA